MSIDIETLQRKYPLLGPEILACLIPSVLNAMKQVEGSHNWNDEQFREWYNRYNAEMAALTQEFMRSQG
jgi:hypothetical protein